MIISLRLCLCSLACMVSCAMWMMALGAGSRLSTPLDPPLPRSSHNNIDFAMQMDMLWWPSFYPWAASVVSSFFALEITRVRRALCSVLPDEPFFCQVKCWGILPYVFLPSFQMLIPRGYGLVLWKLALWCKTGRKWLLCALLFKEEIQWIYNSLHKLWELIHENKWKVSLVWHSVSC
jgi:hypothetical protein